MLKNHLKIAWRNLWKDKFYSGINILGLAVATAAFLLIIHFVKFEYSYENFYEKADDIYRVTYDLYNGSEYLTTDAETHPPMAPMLKEEMPEVANYVRVQRVEEMPGISKGNEHFRVDRIYAADPSMFSIFNYEFIEGEASSALNEPLQAVLTESLARRVFGSTNVIGRTLKGHGQLFTVTAVIKDLPLNTHLKLDMLISFTSLESLGWDLNSWNGNNNYTYLRLLPHTDLNAFNEKLKTFSREKLKDKISKGNLFVAEPIKTIHLHSHKTFEPEANGDIKTAQFLLVTAILILLVGSINYVNLTTARSAERIKEAGMRKILGSSRLLLVKQLLTETFLINLLAMGCALIIVKAMLPAYPHLIGRPVSTDLFSSAGFWGSCLALFIFNCLLSGLYPALTLSSVKPIQVTSKTFTGSFKGNLLRKVLVVGQFAAALIVLSTSFIVYRQLSFMRNQDLGMTTEEVVTVRTPDLGGSDSLLRLKSQVFKNELLQVPDVEKVAVSGALPGLSYHEFGTSTGISRYGSETGKGYVYSRYGIDTHFLSTLEIKLLAGRDFREGTPNNGEVIVNKEAARLLGFKSPEAAVGQRITPISGDLEYSVIVGVVDNYHQLSLKEAVLPMIHVYSETNNFYSVKIHTKDMSRLVAQIERAWKDQFPGYPFEYHFLNELFDQQYKADQHFGKIVGVFSGFTLFITCLGLLGLTAYSVSRRAKEIGVRKVLGASVSNVVALLSGDFIKLAGISILLGTPLAWYAMNRWLQDFAYRIELQWWMFALAGLVVILIALFTVSFQSVKAALMNPVKSLRSE